MIALIKCPNCEVGGIKQNLAAINDDGSISVRRRRSLRNWDQTIIVGNNFSLICGNCGEAAFVRKDNDESLSDRIPRLSGISITYQTGTIGTYSYQR